jgi:hypothetical protein
MLVGAPITATAVTIVQRTPVMYQAPAAFAHTGMRSSISAAIVAIAVSVPLAGCGGESTVVRETSEAAAHGGEAAPSRLEPFHDLSQMRKRACRRAKAQEYSDTLQGRYGDDDDDLGIC